MGRIQSGHRYQDIISTENLLEAWREFLNGKRSKKDVQAFKLQLMDNVLRLHESLSCKTYRHGVYEAFKINDPKPRDIHKATVRDRLLHHAVYRKLYPFFDWTFISDSYSCRLGKGTHRAMDRFKDFARIVSRNHTKTVWLLKCDIKKFFASIDHKILRNILGTYLPDQDIMWLINSILSSFRSTKEGVGLPLGNLTSQLFVNVYMNEFDQFVKHTLKARYYMRYADDFVIMHHSRDILLEMLPKIRGFLFEDLTLTLHPDKVFIRTVSSGVDFLGWVHFPDYRALRTSTKRRMLKKLKANLKPEVAVSYEGMLTHGNTYKLRNKLQLSSEESRITNQESRGESDRS